MSSIKCSLKERFLLFIDILTIFPNMFSGILNESILKRAIKSRLLKVRLHNIRDYSKDKHHKVDDKPFGGGPGMVMRIEPIYDTLRHILRGKKRKEARVILLSPQGNLLTQRLVRKFSKDKHLILICGHYEGIDERVREYLVTDEISIGNYVLTGGEIAALVIVDAIVRFLPGALGDKDSAKCESFSNGLLEYPQYTRPSDFKGMKVPDILLSGNHRMIENWRQEQTIKNTLLKRPELIRTAKAQNITAKTQNKTTKAQNNHAFQGY